MNTNASPQASESSWAASPTGRPWSMPPAPSATSACPWEAKVVSAHRTPALALRLRRVRRGAAVSSASSRVPAAPPTCPAWPPPSRRCRCSAVPVKSRALNGVDSLLSIVQMPAGYPDRHLRDRRGRRHQCRALRGRHAGCDRRRRALPRNSHAFRENQREKIEAAVLPQPADRRDELMMILLRRTVDRRPRRRPARPHARAGGAAHGLPRPEVDRRRHLRCRHTRRPRASTMPFDSAGAFDEFVATRQMSPPSSSRTSRASLLEAVANGMPLMPGPRPWRPASTASAKSSSSLRTASPAPDFDVVDSSPRAAPRRSTPFRATPS